MPKSTRCLDDGQVAQDQREGDNEEASKRHIARVSRLRGSGHGPRGFSQFPDTTEQRRSLTRDTHAVCESSGREKDSKIPSHFRTLVIVSLRSGSRHSSIARRVVARHVTLVFDGSRAKISDLSHRVVVSLIRRRSPTISARRLMPERVDSHFRFLRATRFPERSAPRSSRPTSERAGLRRRRTSIPSVAPISARSETPIDPRCHALANCPRDTPRCRFTNARRERPVRGSDDSSHVNSATSARIARRRFEFAAVPRTRDRKSDGAKYFPTRSLVALGDERDDGSLAGACGRRETTTARDARSRWLASLRVRRARNGNVLLCFRPHGNIRPQERASHF